MADIHLKGAGAFANAGKAGAAATAVIGLAVNGLFFAMFEVWFKVPLFKGALNPLGFLGY